MTDINLAKKEITELFDKQLALSGEQLDLVNSIPDLKGKTFAEMVKSAAFKRKSMALSVAGSDSVLIEKLSLSDKICSLHIIILYNFFDNPPLIKLLSSESLTVDFLMLIKEKFVPLGYR